MEEPTNDETNPLMPGEGEQISESGPMAEEKPELTKEEMGYSEPPKPDDEKPKPKNITPEMEQELKRLLRNTNRGRGLMVRLDAIGRPDLYKNATQILWVKDIQAIDVKVQPFDLNPGLFEQFRAYCWNNSMSYRFDDNSGALVMIVRWFLPDVLPVMDPELKTFAMAEPVKTEPSTLKKTPDLKEVK